MPELPAQLLNSLEKLPFFDRGAFIDAHRTENRVTSVRLNPFKNTGLELEVSREVPWTNQGFYLKKRPSFTLDPLFHAGAYYVQEPGSMFLEHALVSIAGSLRGKKALDLCAAPGGKSTHLNSLIGEDGLLVSNEFVKGRTASLVQNLSKWGTHNTVVTNSEPEKIGDLGSFFDILAVDAPCSGSGLFRKQPEAIGEWSQENVLMCRKRQKDILSESLPALKTGGLLFYSTCSYSIEENEEIVDWLIKERGLEYVPVPLNPAWGVVDTGLGYRFYPDKTESEGFFCAALRKQGPENHWKTVKKVVREPISAHEKTIVGDFLNTEKGVLLKLQGRLHFSSEGVAQFLTDTERKLYLKKAGQFVGEIKGKDMVPSQELAWSIYLQKHVEKIELDTEGAIAFLRKTGFSAESGERGLKLVTRAGLGLGWAKFMQGRVNNYLPPELRILM
jgi:16S rRNA C967 or C1407 C5-methylase (RsmB/RsmF family)/NOL1/NOP2/fmu family ribosome biogenesis protein